jgi:hypothetical protein
VNPSTAAYVKTSPTTKNVRRESGSGALLVVAPNTGSTEFKWRVSWPTVERITVERIAVEVIRTAGRWQASHLGLVSVAAGRRRV